MAVGILPPEPVEHKRNKTALDFKHKASFLQVSKYSSNNSPRGFNSKPKQLYEVKNIHLGEQTLENIEKMEKVDTQALIATTEGEIQAQKPPNDGEI